MKVEEAKTKVCPFMSNTIGDSDGRDNTVMVKCVCGDCMAWVPFPCTIEVETSSELFKQLYDQAENGDKTVIALSAKQGVSKFSVRDSKLSQYGYCARIGNGSNN